MKVFSFRKHLYSVSQASMLVPLVRKTVSDVGAHSDTDEDDGYARFSQNTTTTFAISIPWLSIVRFDPEPSGIFSSLGNDLDP